MTEQKEIAFLCDGTESIGLGHVSRCVALAEAMEEIGLLPHFLGSFRAGASEMIEQAGFHYVQRPICVGDDDVEDSANVLKESGVSAVVLDSYSATDDYIAKLNDQIPVLLIDDFGLLKRYQCSAILCFTLYAKKLNYPVDRVPNFLGPDYFVTRRALRQMRQNVTCRSGDVESAMVAIGGVDRHDLTFKVTQALLKTSPNVQLNVVVGRSYDNIEKLSELVASFTNPGRIDVQLPSLADVMASTDICICAGGMIRDEAAYMGLPTVVLSQNEVQAADTALYAEQGLTLDLGIGTDIDNESLSERLADFINDSELRERISKKGMQVFPEDSTLRAAKALANIISPTA